MYILTEKRGRKQHGLAGTDCKAATCAACAETVFITCGYSVKYPRFVNWEHVQKQKNYVRDPGFKVVECTERERELTWFKAAYRPDLYPTFEEFCDTFPEAREFEAELTG